MTLKIMKAYTRLYRDNGQLTAYVEWSDGARTEGPAASQLTPKGDHMIALFNRADREGVEITHEVWP